MHPSEQPSSTDSHGAHSAGWEPLCHSTTSPRGAKETGRARFLSCSLTHLLTRAHHTGCYSCTVDPASLSTLPTFSVRLPAVVPTRAHTSLFGTSCFFLKRWVCDGQRKTCPSLLRGSAFMSCSAPSTLRTETSTDLRLAMPLCNQNSSMASDRHNKNKAPLGECKDKYRIRQGEGCE